jgi:protein subunit release factor A
MSVSRTAIGVVEPNYFVDALIEIRVGSGGEDAEAFVADLLQMYSTFAQNQGWSTEIVMQQRTDDQHLKLVLLKVVGEGAYPKLKYETGRHRVQRVPKSEGQGRVHTSFASVVVMPIPGELFRLEVIRTYNFPEDEARDHRHKVKVGEVRRIISGDLDLLLSKLPDNS